MHFLVGDVQGCDDALQRLLQRIGFSPSRDQLVLLGDLVNRGPDSLAVLRRLRQLDGAATAVLGNHDLHLLAVAAGARAPHRSDSFHDVLGAADCEAWLALLAGLPLALQAEGWLCVHAGLPPAWDATMALAEAASVQQQLRGPQRREFLLQLYGNRPDRWDGALQGMDRWRYTVNALTRIRFCHADGRLDFETKEGADAAPPGLRPWFELPGRRSTGQPVAFGHWSTLGLINRPDLLALDTGCVWGGALTAVRIDGGRREVFQVACAQAQRPAKGV